MAGGFAGSAGGAGGGGSYGGYNPYNYKRVSPPTRASAQPQMPYQPGAPKVQGLIDPLAKAGKGLLDPESEYIKRLRGETEEDIGRTTAGRKESLKLNAARAGYGTGQSSELLEGMSNIDRAGLEASGEAGADITMRGPAMGASILSPALGAQSHLQDNDLRAWMGQQQLGADQDWRAVQTQMADRDAYMRELMALLSY